MNKADMRAPALIALDLPRLSGRGRTLPEHLEIHLVVPQIPDRLPQFTGTNSPVEIDYGRCLARSTRHRPGGRIVKVLELRSMMERQRSDVCCFLDPLDQPDPVIEHTFRISPLDARQFRINAAQLFAFDLLQSGILGIASNQIEVMPVRNPLDQYEFRQGENLVKVIPRDDGIDIDDQPQAESCFQFAQKAPALQRSFEIAGHTPHEIVRFP